MYETHIRRHNGRSRYRYLAWDSFLKYRRHVPLMQCVI